MRPLKVLATEVIHRYKQRGGDYNPYDQVNQAHNDLLTADKIYAIPSVFSQLMQIKPEPPRLDYSYNPPQFESMLVYKARHPELTGDQVINVFAQAGKIFTDTAKAGNDKLTQAIADANKDTPENRAYWSKVSKAFLGEIGNQYAYDVLHTAQPWINKVSDLLSNVPEIGNVIKGASKVEQGLYGALGVPEDAGDINAMAGRVADATIKAGKPNIALNGGRVKRGQAMTGGGNMPLDSIMPDPRLFSGLTGHDLASVLTSIINGAVNLYGQQDQQFINRFHDYIKLNPTPNIPLQSPDEMMPDLSVLKKTLFGDQLKSVAGYLLQDAKNVIKNELRAGVVFDPTTMSRINDRIAEYEKILGQSGGIVKPTFKSVKPTIKSARQRGGKVSERLPDQVGVFMTLHDMSANEIRQLPNLIQNLQQPDEVKNYLYRILLERIRQEIDERTGLFEHLGVNIHRLVNRINLNLHPNQGHQEGLGESHKSGEKHGKAKRMKGGSLNLNLPARYGLSFRFADLDAVEIEDMDETIVELNAPTKDKIDLLKIWRQVLLKDLQHVRGSYLATFDINPRSLIIHVDQKIRHLQQQLQH